MKTILAPIFFLLLSLNSVRAETIWYPLPPEAFSFGKKYPQAQALLYAFDYGHALVYERLLLNKGQIKDPAAFEAQLLKDIMVILKNPPTVKVDEGDIAPTYVFTFPLVLNIFDWSHLLHQFVLDVLATSNDRGKAMSDRITAIFAQYHTQSIALPSECKSMLFMDGQYFSKDFRKTYPSFNLLIWSYHWFQGILYEALMLPTEKQRDAGVAKAIADFWQQISNLPDSADFDMMPMMSSISPTFYASYPQVAASFDNNHMIHDVVSDILTSPQVPVDKIRSEGVRFGRLALDPNAFKAAHCPEQ